MDIGIKIFTWFLKNKLNIRLLYCFENIISVEFLTIHYVEFSYELFNRKAVYVDNEVVVKKYNEPLKK